MVPVISGKVEERQQRFAILDQAFDRLVVFRRVFLGECRDRRLRCCSIRRQPDFAQVFVRCRERSTSCAASSVGDASKGRSRRELSRSRARHRRRRLPVRSTSRAPSNRRAIPSNSVRSPACRSGNRSTPSCPRASRQSAPACIRPVAPSAPADRHRPPTRKRSGVPTNRAFATPDTRLPTRRRREVRRVLAEQSPASGSLT